jgi:hypothetical protein
LLYEEEERPKRRTLINLSTDSDQVHIRSAARFDWRRGSVGGSSFEASCCDVSTPRKWRSTCAIGDGSGGLARVTRRRFGTS